MELHFEISQRTTLLEKLRPAIFFAAFWCAVSATLELFLPISFLGLLPLLALAFLPQKAKKWCVLALFVLVFAFFVLRFTTVTEGFKILANRMFTISESCQSYEYDYYPVAESSGALWEGLAVLSLTTALLLRCKGALLTLLLLLQAYFGVTPQTLWLLLPLLASLLYVLPRERLWLHALSALFLTGLLALCVTLLAPEPSVRISGWDEQARDRLALHSIFYERTPESIEIPQTEQTPLPPQEFQSDQAVSEKTVNVLFIVLLLITLLLLFVPAVLKDRAKKKRTQNRAGMDDPDAAAAIRAMYLHSQKWLRLKPSEPPQEITALWLEAAYSDHVLADTQRTQMAEYLARVEQDVWRDATGRERLRIQYRLCL